jgi:hypothetical protein
MLVVPDVERSSTLLSPRQGEYARAGRRQDGERMEQLP